MFSLSLIESEVSEQLTMTRIDTILALEDDAAEDFCRSLDLDAIFGQMTTATSQNECNDLAAILFKRRLSLTQMPR